MRITILTQYYPPETGAPQNRLSDLARQLDRMGHTVNVLTAMPNYPRGEVYPGYRGAVYRREEVDGIEVRRCWIVASKGRRIIPRLLNYFSFVFTSMLFGAFALRRADFLFVESPPLFLGLSGYILSRLKGARLIFNVADLWPQAAAELGVITNPTLLRLATRLEEFMYRKSDLVIGLTEGITGNIQARFPNKTVRFLPNGVDTVWFTPDKADPSVLRGLGLEGRFVVGYGGNHGYAQALDTVVEAGDYLKDEPDIVFALFGDGPFKAELQVKVESKGLTNVRFFPWQPRENMPGLVASWALAVVSAVDTPLVKGALPSKMFEAMGAGVPIVLSLPKGEASDVINNARGGVWVEPENPEALARAIKTLYRDPALRHQLGAGGRSYVEAHYSRRQMVERFVGHLSGLSSAQTPAEREFLRSER